MNSKRLYSFCPILLSREGETINEKNIFVSSSFSLLLDGVPGHDGVRVDVPADHLHVGPGPARGQHGHPGAGPRLRHHHPGQGQGAGHHLPRRQLQLQAQALRPRPRVEDGHQREAHPVRRGQHHQDRGGLEKDQPPEPLQGPWRRAADAHPEAVVHVQHLHDVWQVWPAPLPQVRDAQHQQDERRRRGRGWSLPAPLPGNLAPQPRLRLRCVPTPDMTPWSLPISRMTVATVFLSLPNIDNNKNQFDEQSAGRPSARC